MNLQLNPIELTQKQKLNVLVENRRAYTLERCELNVFETYIPSFQVPLSFNNFVITHMVRGRKVMHLEQKRPFDYLPGETVIMPPAERMIIDFPDASEDKPTQCIALAIDQNQISKTIDYLNEFYPKLDSNELWKLNFEDQHFYNNAEISFLTNKIVNLCTENIAEKDALVGLNIKELLVRVMQAQNLNQAQKVSQSLNPLQTIKNYIIDNLNEKISIERLSNHACMSKASFYRLFKRELGISPNDFILNEKIKRAKELLTQSGAKITSISYELGFSDVNYFIRLFKKYVGITPGAYQEQSFHK